MIVGGKRGLLEECTGLAFLRSRSRTVKIGSNPASSSEGGSVTETPNARTGGWR